MLNIDKVWEKAKRRYAGIIMIKEHQMWGQCPTFRLPEDEISNGQVLYYDEGEFIGWEEMSDRLRKYWRPVAQDEREWFCKNL